MYICILPFSLLSVFTHSVRVCDVNQHPLLLMLMCVLSACLSPGAILDAARCLGAKGGWHCNRKWRLGHASFGRVIFEQGFGGDGSVGIRETGYQNQQCRRPVWVRLWVKTAVAGMVPEPGVGGEEEVTNGLWHQVKDFTAHSEPLCCIIPGRNRSSWDCGTFWGLIFRERFGDPWCPWIDTEWGPSRDASSLVTLKSQDRALGTLHAFHDFYPLTPVFLPQSWREQEVQLIGKLNVPDPS